MSGRKDLSWVSLLVSNCIRARREINQNPKFVLLKWVHKLSSRLHMTFRWVQVVKDINLSSDKTTPSLTVHHCHAGWRTATFRKGASTPPPHHAIRGAAQSHALQSRTRIAKPVNPPTNHKTTFTEINYSRTINSLEDTQLNTWKSNILALNQY